MSAQPTGAMRHAKDNIRGADYTLSVHTRHFEILQLEVCVAEVAAYKFQLASLTAPPPPKKHPHLFKIVH